MLEPHFMFFRFDFLHLLRCLPKFILVLVSELSELIDVFYGADLRRHRDRHQRGIHLI